MNLLRSVCILCLLLLVGTLWWRLRANGDVAVPQAAVTGAVARDADAQRPALVAARRSCDAGRLDAFIDRQRQLVARAPADAAAMRLCAEALLERVLLQNQLRGMTVGAPLYRELPPGIARDLDAALDLLQRSRALGDDSAENLRLEASVLGNRITGLGAALQWNRRIEEALAAAARKDPDDPALHVAIGLRQLLAPRLLGQDPDRALEHLRYAAMAMPDDERPRVFAAMAAWLLHKRQQAIAWLEQAAAQNPNNVFARVVLARVRRDEPEPFARDVTVAEAAAR